jgi:hypothetical protein
MPETFTWKAVSAAASNVAGNGTYPVNLSSLNDGSIASTLTVAIKACQEVR